jgi:hypothetical protein
MPGPGIPVAAWLMPTGDERVFTKSAWHWVVPNKLAAGRPAFDRIFNAPISTVTILPIPLAKGLIYRTYALSVSILKHQAKSQGRCAGSCKSVGIEIESPRAESNFHCKGFG